MRKYEKQKQKYWNGEREGLIRAKTKAKAEQKKKKTTTINLGL